MEDASKMIQGSDLSPMVNGLYLLPGAIFSVSIIERNDLQSYAIVRSARPQRHLSPDGKYIAYLSDRSGEFEIYMEAQDGKSAPVQLTTGAIHINSVLPGRPTAKNPLVDQKLRLQYVDIETKKVTTVFQSEYNIPRDFAWSPDSKWIAFTQTASNAFSFISLYSLTNQSISNVTDNWYRSESPAFSNDGKYLVFVSDRDFTPTYSLTEWNTAYRNMSRVYLTILSKETVSPFGPENDTVKVATDAKPVEKKQTEKDTTVENKPALVKIDLDGLDNRTISLPIQPSAYYNVNCINGKVYYSQYDKVSRTKVYDLKEKKETDLGEFSFNVSANCKKMLVIRKITGPLSIYPIRL
jgi:tricorn protease